MIGRIGEADALIRLKKNPERLIHFEVAVKFYLCLDLGGSLDAARFVGPGLKDSLDKKLTRIEGHQLQVLKQSEDEELRTAESEAWVAGILFYPYDPRYGSAHRFIHPNTVQPDHLQGLWIHQSRFKTFITEMNIQKGLFFETKSEWIQERSPEAFLEVSILSDRINEHFTNDTHPVQCEVLISGDKPVRLFIVPDGWPAEFVDPTLKRG